MAMKQRKTITVVLPVGEYTRFSRYCKSFGHKKSTLIARLVREHLDAERFAMQEEIAWENPQLLPARKS
jgi:hypothetical protein